MYIRAGRVRVADLVLVMNSGIAFVGDRAFCNPKPLKAKLSLTKRINEFSSSGVRFYVAQGDNRPGAKKETSTNNQ